MSEFAAAEHLRLVPDAPAGFRQELSELEDRELLALVGSLPRTSHRRAAALDLLVARYRNLVRSCVQRYARSSVPIEDLMQVGYVGLLKAINNFDPALGFSLATYARPCITGEIKKHFRDKSWQVRVGRRCRSGSWKSATQRTASPSSSAACRRTPSWPATWESAKPTSAKPGRRNWYSSRCRCMSH
jgi:RNA polymerase sigma factor (sigma-70 family)